MARKTLIDAPDKPAAKSTPARGEPKNWLVTYSRDSDEQHSIPVEALDGHKAQAVVEANMPGCTIHSVVLDDEARRAVLADGGPATARGQAAAASRAARPDPKPVGKNRGRTKAVSAGVAEKAKPAIKGKTPAAVSKADKAAATGGRKPAAAKAEAPAAAKPVKAPAADAKAELQAKVVKLWNASKEQDAGARRKAIAKELNIPGRVMGILRDAGIDGKKTS